MSEKWVVHVQAELHTVEPREYTTVRGRPLRMRNESWTVTERLSAVQDTSSAGLLVRPERDVLSMERPVPNDNIPTRSDYYEDAEMARLLGISIGRLRNKLSAGDPLPPCTRPPGCRRRLWRRQSVHQWLEEHAVRTGQPVGRTGRVDSG